MNEEYNLNVSDLEMGKCYTSTNDEPFYLIDKQHSCWYNTLGNEEYFDLTILTSRIIKTISLRRRKFKCLH